MYERLALLEAAIARSNPGWPAQVEAKDSNRNGCGTWQSGRQAEHIAATLPPCSHVQRHNTMQGGSRGSSGAGGPLPAEPLQLSHTGGLGTAESRISSSSQHALDLEDILEAALSRIERLEQEQERVGGVQQDSAHMLSPPPPPPQQQQQQQWQLEAALQRITQLEGQVGLMAVHCMLL